MGNGREGQEKQRQGRPAIFLPSSGNQAGGKTSGGIHGSLAKFLADNSREIAKITQPAECQDNDWLRRPAVETKRYSAARHPPTQKLECARRNRTVGAPQGEGGK